MPSSFTSSAGRPAVESVTIATFFKDRLYTRYRRILAYHFASSK
jgi:hypothetical protein